MGFISLTLCGKLGLLFSCWPQPHHSTPPEQHQSLQEYLQKSFYSITPTQHIFHHCRSYLHQWALILHYFPYGTQFGVSTEEGQVFLRQAQFREICEWLHCPGSQFTYSACRKIQNWNRQTLEATFQKYKPGPKYHRKTQTPLPVKRSTHEHLCLDTERCFLVQIDDTPGTEDTSQAILTTSNCRSLNIRPTSIGTKRKCREQGCICVKEEPLPTMVKDFASYGCRSKKKKIVERAKA